MAKTRIGFVGVGGMGQCAHLRNYVVLPDCEVVALAELRTKVAQDVGQRYGIPKVYSDYREMFAKEKLDGIVAPQPFDIHGVLVPELLKYNLPILTEKPLANSVEAGERIVNAVKKHNGRLFAAYHKRSDPASEFVVRQIDEWKQSGKAGKMKFVRMTIPPGNWTLGGFDHMVKSDEKYPELHRDPPPAGMDAATAKRYVEFVNYYIHQVNLMRHLMRADYSVKHVDRQGMVMVTETKDGVVGSLEMNTYQTSVDWQEQMFVSFEKGWIKIEMPPPLATDQPGRVTVYLDPHDGSTPQTVSPSLPMVHAMRNQALNFVKEIRGEKTALCRPEESLKDLLIAKDYIAARAKSEAEAR
jgi:predicted dehydrogenase